MTPQRHTPENVLQNAGVLAEKNEYLCPYKQLREAFDLALSVVERAIMLKKMNSLAPKFRTGGFPDSSIKYFREIEKEEIRLISRVGEFKARKIMFELKDLCVTTTETYLELLKREITIIDGTKR